MTQLYNDAKVSYENTLANRTSTASNDDDPEVAQLRKEFQEQQDRLLAWGMHWADKQSVGTSKGKEAGFEADIDEKVDQAGLGEIVAGIMQSIKSTLAESGQLQHPGRWKESRSPPAGPWGALKDRMGVASPKPNFDKYKEYELVTGRNLLAKLKESIDLLYSLDEGQEDHGVSKSKAFADPSPPAAEHVEPPRFPRSVSATDPVEPKEAARVAHQLISHPLYIDFSRLEPMHDPNAAAEPPSYEEAKENTLPIQPRAVYFLPSMQTYVLVDLVKAKNYPLVEEVMTNNDPFQNAHVLSQLVSLKGLLEWDSHLKLLGFTLAHGNSRFGLVYALPEPSDPTALQACQTLTTSIQATLEHETSFPPLENKFRLAYNIALASTSYLAHGYCHGHLKSSNIIFLRENDNPRLGSTLRCPYVLQPIQKLVGESNINPPLSHTLYHHADADEVGYGLVPAYDVYSVGLLLLEIGLWRPLPAFWKPKYDRAIFHEKLKRYYIPKLASKCGTRYMNLVQACFDAPEQLQDKPQPFDAAEYLLEIVRNLKQCCALDVAAPPPDHDTDTFEYMIESQRMEQQEPSKSSAVPQVPVAPVVNPIPTPAKKPSTSSKVKQKSADTLKKWPDMDIPQDHLETWNTMLMPRLSKMLRNALKDSMDSCSVSLMMIGSTPEKAKTTICVQCKDTARIRETLCKRFTPKSGWGLVICAGDVRRSGQLRKSSKRSDTRRSALDGENVDHGAEKPREQLYQPWPGCGASIGAWCNEQHLPPVSFGGTIIVDGQPYGMTVHHMLDDPDDVDRENDQAGPQAPKRSTAPRYATQTIGLEDNLRLTATEDDALDDMDIYDDDELADTSDDEDMSDAESDASTIRPDYVIMDGEGEEFFIMEDSDDDDDEEPPDLEDDDEGHSSEDTDEEVETGSIGDTPAIPADRLDDEDFCITQPAWDDVPENFFSDDPEYRDEEHLMSHSFGYVHASSGLKRMTRYNVKHEIDWALIKINERRLNLVVNPEAAGLPNRKSSKSSKRRARSSLSGAAFTEPPLVAVTPVSYLPRLQVCCTGRSSGRKVGRISPAMSLLKLPGRQSFSASFTVEGGMGVPGDSGAWVYSEERRELCGHILAWSDALNMAYISPMEVLFDDLKERLNAKEVRLPAQSPQSASVDIIPELVQQESSSTIESTKKGKSNIEDNKENISSIQLAGKLSGLQINTASAAEARERARTMSRSSSKASQRDETSPISAGSAAARRSRAETIPRTQSPTQLPTPPCDSKRKDIYEFGLSSVSVRKGVIPVGKAVPS